MSGWRDPRFLDPLVYGTASAVLSGLDVHADGRVVFGWGGSPSYAHNGVYAAGLYSVLPDGSVDSGWTVTTASTRPTTVVALPNGKTACAGYELKYSGTDRLVAIINDDGSVDTSVSSLDATAGDPYVRWITVDASGNIWLFGDFNAINGHATYKVAKLDPDGELDTSFAAPAITNGGSLAYGYGGCPLADGSVIVCGNFDTVGGVTRNKVCKLSSTGALVTAFVDLAPSVGSGTLAVKSARQMAGGDLILSGHFDVIGGESIPGLARIDPSDGSVITGWPETALSTNIDVPFFLIDSSDTVYYPVFNNGIKIVILGILEDGGAAYEQFSPVRVTRSLISTVDVAMMALGADQTITFSGKFDAVINVPSTGIGRVRTTPDPVVWEGMLDSGFLDPANVYSVLCTLPDGQMLVADNHDILRLNADGTVDTTFTAAVDGYPYGATPLTGDRYMIVGNFTTCNSTARDNMAVLDLDGSLNSSFPSMDMTGFLDDSLSRAVQDASGNIWVGGNIYTMDGHTSYGAVKMSNAGVVDTGYAAPATNSAPKGFLLLADGGVLIYGGFSAADGSTYKGAFKTTSDGTLDTTFTNPAISGRSEYVADAVQLSTGDLVLVGSFQTVHGSGLSSFSLCRLNASTSALVAYPSVKNDQLLPDSTDYEAIALDSSDRIYLGRGPRVLASGAIDRTYEPVRSTSSSFFRAKLSFDESRLITSGLFTDINETSVNKIASIMLEAPEGGAGSGLLLLSTEGIGVTPGEGEGLITLSGSATGPGVESPGGAAGTITLIGSAEGGAGVLPMAEGSGIFVLTGHGLDVIAESVTLGDVIVGGSGLVATPGMVIRERLVTMSSRLATYEGTHTLNDAIAMGDSTAYVLFVLIEEGLVLSGVTAPDYTVIARVIARLILEGHATSYIDAVVQIIDAMVLGALTDAMTFGGLSETVVMNDVISGLYLLFAQVLEKLVLSDTATGTSTAYVLLHEAVVIGDSLGHGLEMTAALHDSIGFVANLTFDDGEYIAWVLNTEGSKAVSRYTNFPFNSFAKLGDRYIGADSTGLHWLDGEDDTGEAINARLRAGMSSMGSTRLKRLPEAFIAYTSDGTLLLRVIQVDDETGEKVAGNFLLRQRPATNAYESRFEPGRGWKAVSFDIELENVDGSDFDLTSLEFRPLMLDRRTRG